jgi:MYXO-CTERM domain-containing protein
VKPAARVGLLTRSNTLTLASFVHGALPPESMLSAGGATPALFFASTNAPVDAGAQVPAVADMPDAATRPPLPPTAPPQGGCAGCATSGNETSGGAIAALLGLVWLRVRRPRRRER